MLGKPVFERLPNYIQLLEKFNHLTADLQQYYFEYCSRPQLCQRLES